MRIRYRDKVFSPTPVCLIFNADDDMTIIGRDSRAIPPYRVFPDERAGPIVAAPHVIEALDDDDAIRAAQELTSGTAASFGVGPAHRPTEM